MEGRERWIDVSGRLASVLSRRRFRHVLSVARWARALAERQGEDPDRAHWAGLLHDCGKEIPGPAQARLVEKWRLPVPDKKFILDAGHLGLFHAHVSAALAEREYGMKDKAVLSAIRSHTLGAEKMSRLDRVLYVADFSSPDRRYAAAARVRRLARKDLDLAFREVLRWKLRYVLDAGAAVHPLTIRLWNQWRRP
jgi:predicted HD superfamily hydrolase involved in NAD metabolism